MSKSEIDNNTAEFAERLKLAIGSQTMRSFSTQYKINFSTLHSYLSGNSQPSLAQLVKLAEATKTNVGWLATGDGEMYQDSEENLSGTSTDGLIAIPIDDSDEIVYFSKKWLENKKVKRFSNLSIIVMPDDSMFPTIKEQEFVVIEKTNEISSDGVYAFKHREKLYIKRIQDKVGEYALLSDNTLYAPISLNNSDSIEVVGKLVVL